MTVQQDAPTIEKLAKKSSVNIKVTAGNDSLLLEQRQSIQSSAHK
jgi:hypothetical protein